MQPTRRDFLRKAASTTAAAGLLRWTGMFDLAASADTVQPAEQPPRRPNFLIFLVDDLGWGDLGCYGGKVIKTPNLDAFRQEGLKLNACYAGYAICQPSRVSLMTGRVPNRLGIANNKTSMPASEVFFAKLLRDAGYATAFVGKCHLGINFEDPSRPGPDFWGFDHFFGAGEQDKGPDLKNPKIYDPTNVFTNGCKPAGPQKGHPTTVWVNEAIRWLTDRPKDKPFCLNLWTHAPHGPHAVIPEFEKDYEGTKSPKYNQVVAHLDMEFGRLMKALDELGLRDNTIVLFSSDNGPTPLHSGSSGPFRGGKFVCYEGGVRVAGLVRWPGRIEPGSETGEPVAFVDIQPTLCKLAGAKISLDRNYDGTDVTGVLTEGKHVDRPRPLFWHTVGDRYMGAPPMVAMRDGDWKIVTEPTFAKSALYNLKDDPGEKNDLSAKEPAKAADLLEKCRKLYEEVQADAAIYKAKGKPAPKSRAQVDAD